MKISVIKKRDEDISGSLVFLLTKEQTNTIKKKPQGPIGKIIKEAIVDGDFTGDKGAFCVLKTQGKVKAKRIIVLGVGENKKVDMERIRRASSAVVQTVQGLKQDNLAFSLQSYGKVADDHVAIAIVEGCILGSYKFDKYLSKKNKPTKIKTLMINYKGNNTKQIITQAERTRITCENVLLSRDLVNDNADVVTTLEIERVARMIGKKSNVTCTVFKEAELKKKGFNLLLAVGRGSSYPPRFILLEYKGDPRSKDKIAIVGKGITFDSGGLNLKPTGYMETMKCDMSGVATVLGTLKAAAELKLKKNIIGVIPTCENAIGSKSYKPGDVYTSYNGKSVEIGNTDAEGRLILADALGYTEKVLKPKMIVDLATLTGSALYALGEWIACLLTDNDKLADQFFKCGQKTGERLWRLPMYEDFKEDMKCETADVPNIQAKRYAGTIYAAVFLNNFVEKTPWVHLDIAGPAWYEQDKWYAKKGGTGFGVRLLIEFLSK